MLTDVEMARRVRGHREIIRTETEEALAAYFAGELLDRFIYPFSRVENVEKLMWRRFQTRKHYRNYPKEIGRKYLEGLFRAHPITRKYGDPVLDGYLTNTYDRWFARNVAMPSLYLPELFIIGSMPNSTFRATNALEEDVAGNHPYPVIIYPQHVRDFELDSDGNVVWITFEVSEIAGEGGVGTVGNIVHTYTDELFFRSTVTLNQNSTLGVAIDADSYLEHGFPRCPVVRIAYEENAAFAGTGFATPVGHAMMREIVSLSIADLQFRSMLVEACYSHLFYKMIMGEETAEDMAVTPPGNNTVIKEAADEKNQTRYLPTPQFEIQALEKIVFEQIPAQIYQEARLRDHSVAIAQSGLSKTFDMVPETGVLHAIAEFWSENDSRIIDMIAGAWMGDKYDSSKVQITYPASFDVRTPLETMGQFTQFQGMALSSALPTSRTATREMVKEVQRALLPSASAELLQVIDSETDIAPFAPTTDVPGAPGGPLPQSATVAGLHNEQQTVEELRYERILDNPNL